MEIGITHVLHLIFVTVLLLSGLFILILRNAKPPTLYMALALLLASAIFTVNFLQNYNMPYYGLTLFNPLHLLIPLVCFPLQFAYILSLMRPESVRRSYWFATLIPAVVLSCLYFILISVKEEALVFTNYSQIAVSIGEPEFWLRMLAFLFIIVEVTVLSIKALDMQRQHVRNIQSDFSYTDGVSLWWIQCIVCIFIIRCCCSLLNVALEGAAIKLFNAVVFALEVIFTTICVLKQKDLYGESASNEEDSPEPVPDRESNAPEWQHEKHSILKQNLLDLLEKDEIFKDPELNSEKVRAMLATNRTYLSQVISQEMNTTFYNLINTYRLNKSVEMMNDPQHRHVPLKNIAEICGFKSLSAFSTFFKQTYGKTPTEWRRG